MQNSIIIFQKTPTNGLMMKTCKLCFLVFLFTVAANVTTAAPVTASISSNANLSALEVGDSFGVQVSITGLFPGVPVPPAVPTDSLESLSVVVEYDNTLLSVPTILPGPILPDPLALLSIAGPFPPGLPEGRVVADGVFVQGFPSGLPITRNGLFFEFSVTVLDDALIDSPEGISSSFLITSASVTGTDAFGADIDQVIVPVDSLSYQIVPEPSSAMLLSGLAVLTRRRRGR